MKREKEVVDKMRKKLPIGIENLRSFRRKISIICG